MLFVIRAHQPLPKAVIELAHVVAGALGHQSVVVAADERKGLLDTGGFRKISVSPEIYAGMGLRTPSDVMWRCGDYALYAVRASFPSASSIMMIEADVRLKFADPATEILKMAGTKIDLVVPRLAQPWEGWAWDEPASLLYPGKRWACLFPIVHVRSAAIDHLFFGRLSAGTRPDYAEQGPNRWLNDEAYIANELLCSGFTGVTLGAVWPDSGEWDTFRWRPPHLEEDVDARPPDGRVYHPVLPASDFVKKVFSDPRGSPDWATNLLRAYGYEVVEGRAKRLTGRPKLLPHQT